VYHYFVFRILTHFLYHEQTRVSGVMTNAPFILNVDCEVYVHNPKIVLHALCILLDSKGEKEVAFAQCIQQYDDGLKDDPFGNQLVAAFLVSQVSQKRYYEPPKNHK